MVRGRSCAGATDPDRLIGISRPSIPWPAPRSTLVGTARSLLLCATPTTRRCVADPLGTPAPPRAASRPPGRLYNGGRPKWPFLCDPQRIVQKDLDIQEYTDPENDSTIPYTKGAFHGLLVHGTAGGPSSSTPALRAASSRDKPGPVTLAAVRFRCRQGPEPELAFPHLPAGAVK